MDQNENGLLLVTHGVLGEGLRSSLELIVGSMKNIRAIGLYPGENTDTLIQKIHYEVRKLHCNNVVIAVDLYGGTPFNCALLAQQSSQDRLIRVITGVNLPMLIGFWQSAGSPLQDLLSEMQSAGMNGIRSSSVAASDAEQVELK